MTGPIVRIALTHDIYSPAAIDEAILAFNELCSVERESRPGRTDLRVHLRDGSPPRICDDFLNYVLELSAHDILTRD